MTDTSPRSTPRGWLRFSLRFLLLCVTAFAIGFPIWYRWPYEEVELHYPPKAGKPDTSQPPYRRNTKTWQRSWGSLQPRIVKSVSELLGKSQYKEIQYFQDGVWHGPFYRYVKGKLLESGHFRHGSRDGEWEHYPNGDPWPRFTAHWRQGRLDGLYQVEFGDGRKSQVLFAAGRVANDNGRALPNFLFERLQAGAVDNPKIADELKAQIPMGVDFVETPLKDAIAF
jgi:hypothetical protein